MRSILSAAVVGVLTLGCSGRYVTGTVEGQGGSNRSGPTTGESGGASSSDAGRTPATGAGAPGTSGDMSGTTGTEPSAGSPNTAGGSTGAAGGSTGPSVCDGRTFRGEAFIDDFESDARFIGWYAFSDTLPPNMPLPERVMLGALGTMYAGRVSATGIRSTKAMGYGAGFGFGLIDPAKGNCIDLSAFTGISFWLKGTAGADDSLKFQIVSAVTQPADSQPPGDCPSSASLCAFKHPAKVVRLTADWEHVVMSFADLTPASAFVPNKVLGFNLLTDGPDYDVEIDEVTFFKDTAPSGPVGP